MRPNTAHLYFIFAAQLENNDTRRISMSKRKPRYEGPDCCDYQDLFDSITTELENLYHTLWDKRNGETSENGMDVVEAWKCGVLA